MREAYELDGCGVWASGVSSSTGVPRLEGAQGRSWYALWPQNRLLLVFFLGGGWVLPFVEGPVPHPLVWCLNATLLAVVALKNEYLPLTSFPFLTSLRAWGVKRLSLFDSFGATILISNLVYSHLVPLTLFSLWWSEWSFKGSHKIKSFYCRVLCIGFPLNFKWNPYSVAEPTPPPPLFFDLLSHHFPPHSLWSLGLQRPSLCFWNVPSLFLPQALYTCYLWWLNWLVLPHHWLSCQMSSSPKGLPWLPSLISSL